MDGSLGGKTDGVQRRASLPHLGVKMKRVVLNLKEMRARASDAPVIVDFDGNEHAVIGLSVDAYLSIMGVQEKYSAISAGEVRSLATIAELIGEIKTVITAAMPAFPVGGLQLEELMAVVQALQGAVDGETETDGGAGGDAEPGESTSDS